MAFILGMQYLNRNDRDMARQYLAQAHKGDRSSFEYAMAFSRILSSLKEWENLIAALEPFGNTGRRNFELAVFLGRAYQSTGRFSDAITQFLRAISYRGYITNVLNDLGQCYVETGNTERAIWAWQGHYAGHEPRTPSEIPDATVEATADVGPALAEIDT